MNHVVILGAGFSRALSSDMPLTDELGTAVINDPEIAKDRSFPAQFSDGRFESWLSRLAEPQPDLTDAVNLENRATFMRVSERIRDVVWSAQQRVLGASLKWEIQRFIGVLHSRRSVVITFNYDTLVEHAVTSPPRRDWQSGRGIVGGTHLINDRPPTPQKGGMFAPQHAQSFKLLKLHGSIDTYWVADDHTGSTIARLPSGGGWRPPSNGTAEDISARNNLLPGRVPFIVPPAASKSSFYTNPLTRQLWREASSALSAADCVDIIGYSLPLTDLVTSGMLADVLGPSSSRINVVNPSPRPVADRLQALGVERSRVLEFGGKNCIASYVEALERAVKTTICAQNETIETARQRDLPVLVATSDQHATPAIAANTCGEDSTTLRLAVGPVGHLDAVVANATRPDERGVRTTELLARSSSARHVLVYFGNDQHAYVVDTTIRRGDPGALILVPSTMPTR